MHQYLQDAPVNVCCMRVEGGRNRWCIIRFRLEDFLQLTTISFQFSDQKILNVLFILALLSFNLSVC